MGCQEGKFDLFDFLNDLLKGLGILGGDNRQNFPVKFNLGFFKRSYKAAVGNF